MIHQLHKAGQCVGHDQRGPDTHIAQDVTTSTHIMTAVKRKDNTRVKTGKSVLLNSSPAKLEETTVS